jgi:mevalonate kinase
MMISFHIPDRLYPAKVLLFGEYAVVVGGQALAMPLKLRSGHWERRNEPIPEVLQQFIVFLEQQASAGSIPFPATPSKLRELLEAGWKFHSNIPIGYGLGSSGAFCAAVYDLIATNPDKPKEARTHLAWLESFFHGKSSGIDPMVSWLNASLVFSADKEFKVVRRQRPMKRFFLISTGIARETAPLVQRFLEKCQEQPEFETLVRETLGPLNEEAIQYFLDAQTPELWAHWKAISQFQWEHFREWIPDNMHRFWLKGLQSDAYALKLCGASGGGYLLGMSNHETEPHSFFPGKEVIHLQG